MARVAINTGATPNDGTGDNLRAAGGIINNNFLELYTYLGAGSTDTLSVPLWNTTASGINTLRNVGLGTTNPRFALEVGSVGASGTSLWVNGDARITGILTIGTSSITLNGSSNIINVGSGITINGNTGIISATSIVVGGTTLTGSAVTSITAGSGISINQSTGNVTITATGGGGGESYWTSTTAGINTLSKVGIGTTNPTSTLTVKGNTSLETLSVSGVSTFSDIYLGNGSAYLVYSGSNVVFTQPSGTDGSDDVGGFKFVTTDPGLPSSLETALSIYSAGSYWDRLVRVHRNLQVDNNITVNGTSTFAGITTVTGNTLFTKQLSVSGVSTFNSNIKINGSNIKLGDGSENAGNQIKLGNGSGSPDAFGDSADLWIYHNSSYGNLLQDITGTGVQVWTNGFYVKDTTASTTYFSANTLGNSEVDLYYNNSKKLTTTSTGISVSGIVTAISGIVTYYGDGSKLTGVSASNSRTTISTSTGSIGAGSTTNLDINGYKAYSLLKVGITSAAWVVLYTDSTSRSNDSTRLYTSDPTPGSGVIAEVRTTSSGISTFLMTPGIIGWNNDVSVGSTIYARVTNNESSNSNIIVNLTVVKLED